MYARASRKRRRADRIGSPGSAHLGCALGVCAVLSLLAFAAPAHAQIDAADPLAVPRGAGPDLPPGLLTPDARIDAAISGFRERGYRDLPVLAEAALGSSGPEAVERALEAAPSIPAVHYAVARRSGNPLAALQAVGLAFANLPSLAWLASWIGAALGVGLLAAAAALVALGLVRSLGLHGHRIGHLVHDRDPPAWPGGLVVASGLALLPLLGAGPFVLIAIAGVVSAFRLTRREGVWIGATLLACAVVLGPALPIWASFATLGAREPAVLSAWRIERQQPLPGDQARLERTLGEQPEHAPLRLANAVASKRAGDLDRVQSLLNDFQGGGATVQARAESLKGTVLLARGDVRAATVAFESAAARYESAPLLYNLSQAHGRGLRLADQGRSFAAARELDPDLVSRYTSLDSPNVHHALIEAPLPLARYLGWAIEASPESRALVRDVRERTLGVLAPDRAWIGVGLLGFVSLFLRNASIRRCSRCQRALCGRCSSVPQKSDTKCARCSSLFAQTATMDARLRKEQLARDRRRTRGMTQALAGLGAVVPGAARIFEGNSGTGALLVAVTAFGVAILWTRALHAIPPEVGSLAETLPTAFATLVLAPVYLLALAESARRLRGLRRRL